MFKIATSYLGISFLDYYEMTPKELKLILEGYEEKYKRDLEMKALATRLAIFNAIKGKNHKLFSNDIQNKKISTIEKQKQLKELKEIFT
ncbi:hypothetical protein [Paramaledivibacter caminithermalis]|jgi:hypothetical protein|uniref:Uncharacterized protein n=1 Tax=Paramaledivibacter caminithermalis (strain DSM 15212 / CIP 107654 / DViRD3) TaxID=1121301 RepID=A0A1M6SWJ9_PARC5|nr:hypothetical protein [Paramaledivibacter caminithermalis]SHK49020.1 hypothetical protein SAMN02745912_03461 [Paramaledivibacter caminithermalis DSM 15212]